MRLPEPEPGLVIRYDYLWNRDAEAGRKSGKERPACLVAALDSDADPRFVVVLPITHSRPRDGVKGIEIPARVCEHLGLDADRSWVIVSEFNVDDWPNAGLAPVPGRTKKFSYGFLPPGLFARVKVAFLDVHARGKSRQVRR